MKRITLVLCLILVCSLLFVGCSKKNDGDLTPSATPNVTSTPDVTDGGDDDNGILPGDDDGIVPGDDDDGVLPGNSDAPGNDDSGTAAPSGSPTASPAA